MSSLTLICYYAELGFMPILVSSNCNLWLVFLEYKHRCGLGFSCVVTVGVFELLCLLRIWQKLHLVELFVLSIQLEHNLKHCNSSRVERVEKLVKGSSRMSVHATLGQVWQDSPSPLARDELKINSQVYFVFMIHLLYGYGNQFFYGELKEGHFFTAHHENMPVIFC